MSGIRREEASLINQVDLVNMIHMVIYVYIVNLVNYVSAVSCLDHDAVHGYLISTGMELQDSLRS